MEAEITVFQPVYEPATITADFDAMRAKLAELMAPYEGLDEKALASLSLKEAKGCRTDLNKIIKSVEDGRKAVKREYNAPLAEFEAKVKEVLEPAIEARDRLDGYVKAIEDREREQRRAVLYQAYADYAPALMDAVPFERIVEREWLNKSFAEKKAVAALEDKVAGIARDWESLKKLQLGYYDEAEREFFRTLSLQAAIDRNDEVKAEAERIEALKAEVEANRAEPEQADLPNVEWEPEPEPEPEQIEPEPVHAEPETVAYVLELTPEWDEWFTTIIRTNGIKGTAIRCPGITPQEMAQAVKEALSND